MIMFLIAVGLAAPAAASALTSSRDEKAVANKLAEVYGNAWLDHTPSWSHPECLPEEDDNPPGIGQCTTELEHAGVWRLVDASVSGGTVK